MADSKLGQYLEELLRNEKQALRELHPELKEVPDSEIEPGEIVILRGAGNPNTIKFMIDSTVRDKKYSIFAKRYLETPKTYPGKEEENEPDNEPFFREAAELMADSPQVADLAIHMAEIIRTARLIPSLDDPELTRTLELEYGNDPKSLETKLMILSCVKERMQFLSQNLPEDLFATRYIKGVLPSVENFHEILKKYASERSGSD